MWWRGLGGRLFVCASLYFLSSFGFLLFDAWRWRMIESIEHNASTPWLDDFGDPIRKCTLWINCQLLSLAFCGALDSLIFSWVWWSRYLIHLVPHCLKHRPSFLCSCLSLDQRHKDHCFSVVMETLLDRAPHTTHHTFLNALDRCGWLVCVKPTFVRCQQSKSLYPSLCRQSDFISRATQFQHP